MQIRSTIDRRHFLRISSLSGAAFLLGFSSIESENPQVVNLSGIQESFELTPYIIIEKSGQITIMNPRPEMGQGTFQAVPALIAEELEVSLDHVSISQTAGDKEFGRQVSEGSSSVRTNYSALRK